MRYTLELDGQCIMNNESPPDCLRCLVTTCVAFDGGLQVGVEPLFSRPDTFPNRGLRDVVTAILASEGYCVDVVVGEKTIDDISSPVPVGPNDGRLADPGLPEFLFGQHQGLIATCPGISRDWICLQMIQAFPKERFSLLVTSSYEARNLAMWLRSRGVKATLSTGQEFGEPEDVERVVVATPIGLSDGAVEHVRRHFCVVLHAAVAFRKDVIDALAAVDAQFRLFGLLDVTRRLSAREHDLLMAVLGPHRLVIRTHGQLNNDVRIHFVRIRGAKISTIGSVPELRRAGFFANDLRNRLIAQLARSVADSDSDRIAKRSPKLADYCLGHRFGVVLVVENTSHLRQLVPQLRGWPVVTSDIETSALRKIAPGVSNASPWESPRRVIATLDGYMGMSLDSIDVLIWAAGGTGGAEIPQSRLISRAGHASPLLIVDFRDEQHPKLLDWSRDRLASYLDHEWLPIGVDPVAYRINKFLATRPTSKGNQK